MLLTLPEVVMAENKIQFQKGLSVSEFMQRYGTDEQCHKALEKMKWPHGYECENCGHKSFSYIKSRKLFQCNRCKHQTTVIRKTVFHSTNLPLTTWFLAMYFITQCKNGISSMELMKHLGVSYKTAWKMRHKLMQVMVEQDVKKNSWAWSKLTMHTLAVTKVTVNVAEVPKTSNPLLWQSK
jgi:ribosomal protein L37AE/L43A